MCYMRPAGDTSHGKPAPRFGSYFLSAVMRKPKKGRVTHVGTSGRENAYQGQEGFPERKPEEEEHRQSYQAGVAGFAREFPSPSSRTQTDRPPQAGRRSGFRNDHQKDDTTSRL